MPVNRFRAQVDDLSSAAVQDLLAEHLRGMHANSPPGHVHALALEGLRQPQVTFWSVWDGLDLCGCGALKELDRLTGEIKSMRTRTAWKRLGVGQFVLDEITRTARDRGYRVLCLETGTGVPFEAAHALYLRNGFSRCGAFGDYVATDFNIFMAKRLDEMRDSADTRLGSGSRRRSKPPRAAVAGGLIAFIATAGAVSWATPDGNLFVTLMPALVIGLSVFGFVWWRLR